MPIFVEIGVVVSGGLVYPLSPVCRCADDSAMSGVAFVLRSLGVLRCSVVAFVSNVFAVRVLVVVVITVVVVVAPVVDLALVVVVGVAVAVAVMSALRPACVTPVVYVDIVVLFGLVSASSALLVLVVAFAALAVLKR